MFVGLKVKDQALTSTSERRESEKDLEILREKGREKEFIATEESHAGKGSECLLVLSCLCIALTLLDCVQ